MKRYIYLFLSILIAGIGIWCLVYGTRHDDLRFIVAAVYEFGASFLLFTLGYEDHYYDEDLE